MQQDTRRAAVYARFSTDLQSDRSIEDQVALCRDYAAKEGLIVAQVYSDRARTSASMLGRDGLLNLLRAAQDGQFDVLVVEAIDRISRDQEDLAGLHKRLEFAGVEIRTAHGGRASMIEIGVQGLMGQIWLAQNKEKVRRGMTGVVRDGRHAGGRAYGYEPILGRRGELVIVETEAEIIRRIFGEYIDGSTPREIAAGLNADGVPAPRGTRWNASTINGNAERGYGILNNEIYRGNIVWNRVRMVLNPDTGRRVSRVNPESEWQWADAQHLRIVPEKLWDEVREKRRAKARINGQKGRAPLRPLSGLLRCGCCGAGMAIRKRRGNSIWIGCSRRHESGDCDNGTQPRLDKIEEAVFQSLAEELRDPEYVQAYLKEYHAERERAGSKARKNKASLQRATSKATGAYERAHDLYINGITDGPKAVENIRNLNAKMKEAEAALAAAESEVPTIEIHPAARDRFISALSALGQSLQDFRSPSAATAVEEIRKLIGSVTITPDADGGHTVVVEGYLSEILGEKWGGLMVAEEGLEPPTRGL